MRRSYRENSERTGVAWTSRRYDPNDWEDSDAVNKALSAANAALYGVVHSIVVALGCAPGLGFIHTGHQLSFVYDIADLYKADLTIPLAFDIVANDCLDIGPEARHQMREELHAGRLLERCARDIHKLLLNEELAADTEAAEEPETDKVSIWDEFQGSVSGGVSYGETV